MRPYTVYHYRNGVAPRRLRDEKAPRTVKLDNYERVAEVTASDLEEVFEVTNTVDAPWWNHLQVSTLHVLPPLRSTSVGDLVASGHDLWLVEGIGWRQVRWEAPAKRERRRS